MSLFQKDLEPAPRVEPFRNKHGGLSMRIYGLLDDVYEFGNYATMADLENICNLNGYQLLKDETEEVEAEILQPKGEPA